MAALHIMTVVVHNEEGHNDPQSYLTVDLKEKETYQNSGGLLHLPQVPFLGIQHRHAVPCHGPIRMGG